MRLIDGIILNCVLLLFPLCIYTISNVYSKVKDGKLNSLFFEISLFSSIYLLFRHGMEITSLYPMIIFNIPLFIAYTKNKTKTAVLLSTILICYYHSTIGLSYLTLILEYALYYFSYIYVISLKKCSLMHMLSNFVFIKAFFVTYKTFSMYRPATSFLFNVLEILLTMSTFIFIAVFSLKLLEKAEKILDLNKINSELEKEKLLRASLFKITHEIKNPIAVCKGYLDMIDYNDKNKCQKYIDIVKDQIKRTLILMDDFLDYTKININKEEVDLYMLLEDSCEVVYPLLKSNNITLNYDIPDKELYMNIDYNRMKQVIVNVFKNSIEAIDKRKQKKFIDIKVYEKNDEVAIKIKDNGIGMDAKVLKRVDEMFFTTKQKGTGLGVALSKEIISLHNGSIKYSSQKGKYTIVTIKLPIKKEKNCFSFNNKNYCNNKA